MLGDNANNLVMDSQRSISTHTLLNHNSTLIGAIQRESHSLATRLQQDADEFNVFIEEYGTQAASQGPQAEMTISALTLQRNRRALLVYHQQRVDLLKDLFWSKGGSLTNAFGDGTETRKHMAPADEAFAFEYWKLCLEFKTSVYGKLADGRINAHDPAVSLMDATDLLGGGTEMEPPRDLLVSVRVLKDVGEVETLSGSRMTLVKGSQYYLAREDVENLVVAGALEIIDE